VQELVRERLLQAYHAIEVDPQAFLIQVRNAHGLQVSSYEELRDFDLRALDQVAGSTIRAARKIAAVEGAGLGFGGFATLLPDFGILAAISVRTVQKIGLTYGFLYCTDEEKAEMWIALATAAGADISRDLLERKILRRFVPRVIETIAAKVGVEVAEKSLARVVPVLSSALGATLNYYFVQGWGQRAQRHYRQKNLDLRAFRLAPQSAVLSRTLLPAPVVGT
jgi:hypothetical protein